MRGVARDEQAIVGIEAGVGGEGVEQAGVFKGEGVPGVPGGGEAGAELMAGGAIGAEIGAGAVGQAVLRIVDGDQGREGAGGEKGFGVQVAGLGEGEELIAVA